MSLLLQGLWGQTVKLGTGDHHRYTQTLRGWSHSVLTTAPGGQSCLYAHFTDEELRLGEVKSLAEALGGGVKLGSQMDLKELVDLSSLLPPAGKCVPWRMCAER